MLTQFAHSQYVDICVMLWKGIGLKLTLSAMRAGVSYVPGPLSQTKESQTVRARGVDACVRTGRNHSGHRRKRETLTVRALEHQGGKVVGYTGWVHIKAMRML